MKIPQFAVVLWCAAQFLLAGNANAGSGSEHQFVVLTGDRSVADVIDRWAEKSGADLDWICQDCRAELGQLTQLERVQLNTALRRAQVSALDDAVTLAFDVVNDQRSHMHSARDPLHLYYWKDGAKRSVRTQVQSKQTGESVSQF